MGKGFSLCADAIPDLEGTGAQNTRTLVLGQVWGGSPLVISHLLFARQFHNFSRGSGVEVTRYNDIVAVGGVVIIGIAVFALEIFLARLLFIEDILGGFVVEAARAITLETMLIVKDAHKF